MIVKTLFRMFLVILCTFVALAGARIGLVRPSTDLAISEEASSLESPNLFNHVQAVSLTSTAASLAATVFSTSSSASQNSGVTAASSPNDSTAETACVTFPRPGLLHPCNSRVASLHTSHHVGSTVKLSNWAKNLTTTTETEVKYITETRTITLTISELTSSPTTFTITTDSSPSMTMATGLCFWEDEAILTPCTSMVFASATPSSAAIPRERNPFKGVGDGVRWAKKILAFIGVHG